MSDNPFAEPDDSDRTVIRPAARSAGARPPPSRKAAPRGPRRPRLAAGFPIGESGDILAIGLNPLVAAAAPLLQLLARLRNTIQQPDPGELRERTVRAGPHLRAGAPAMRRADGPAAARRITRCAPASTTWC